MRHPPRFALLLGAVLLATAIAGYTGFWFVAAGRIETGIGDWAQSMHAHNLDLSWRDVHIRGYPFAFRVDMAEARLRDRSPAFAAEVQVPHLSASASPWNFYVWRFAAPGGLSAQTEATAAGATHPSGQLFARTASGRVLVGASGGATLWFDAGDVAAGAGTQFTARQVYLWLIFPAHPAQAHTDLTIAAALDAWGLSLPIVPPPLRNPVDEIAFGFSVKGEIPAAPPRQAAEAWRDQGGTAELDHFALRWGRLAIHASGTLALDSDLQPMGALSGGVEGYPELMRALVAAGRMRRSDADIADLALSLLARTGPNGRPEIATSLTIQDGQMFLGPARLGPLPHVGW